MSIYNVSAYDHECSAHRPELWAQPGDTYVAVSKNIFILLEYNIESCDTEFKVVAMRVLPIISSKLANCGQ